jgi:hypothetical protein
VACPDVGALGLAEADAHDPWGHAIQLTCNDQPADEIVGVVFAGPDGVMGTTDDVASWLLSAELTAVVHGPRWTAATTPPAEHDPGSSHPATKRTPPKPKPKPHLQLDANGIPLQR